MIITNVLNEGTAYAVNVMSKGAHQFERFITYSTKEEAEECYNSLVKSEYVANYNLFDGIEIEEILVKDGDYLYTSLKNSCYNEQEIMASEGYWNAKAILNNLTKIKDFTIYADEDNGKILNICWLKLGYVSPSSNAGFFHFSSIDEFNNQYAEILPIDEYVKIANPDHVLDYYNWMYDNLDALVKDLNLDNIDNLQCYINTYKGDPQQYTRDFGLEKLIETLFSTTYHPEMLHDTEDLYTNYDSKYMENDKFWNYIAKSCGFIDRIDKAEKLSNGDVERTCILTLGYLFGTENNFTFRSIAQFNKCLEEIDTFDEAERYYAKVDIDAYLDIVDNNLSYYKKYYMADAKVLSIDREDLTKSYPIARAMIKNYGYKKPKED